MPACVFTITKNILPRQLDRKCRRFNFTIILGRASTVGWPARFWLTHWHSTNRLQVGQHLAIARRIAKGINIFSVVCRYSSTTIPLFTLRPASTANWVFGFKPAAEITASTSIALPGLVLPSKMSLAVSIYFLLCRINRLKYLVLLSLAQVLRQPAPGLVGHQRLARVDNCNMLTLLAKSIASAPIRPPPMTAMRLACRKASSATPNSDRLFKVKTRLAASPLAVERKP